jgi:hypothetical protein
MASESKEIVVIDEQKGTDTGALGPPKACKEASKALGWARDYNTMKERPWKPHIPAWQMYRALGWVEKFHVVRPGILVMRARARHLFYRGSVIAAILCS